MLFHSLHRFFYHNVQKYIKYKEVSQAEIMNIRWLIVENKQQPSEATLCMAYKTQNHWLGFNKSLSQNKHLIKQI